MAADAKRVTQTASDLPQELDERKLEIPTNNNKPAARFQSSRSPYLYTSTSTRLQRISRTPYLYASYTSLHRLQTSTALEANTSTSARLQHDSRAPELPFLYAYTPTARLPSSRAPYLYASTSARLQSPRTLYLHVCAPAVRLPSSHSSTPTRPLRASRLGSAPLGIYTW